MNLAPILVITKGTKASGQNESQGYLFWVIGTNVKSNTSKGIQDFEIKEDLIKLQRDCAFSPQVNYSIQNQLVFTPKMSTAASKA